MDGKTYARSMASAAIWFAASYGLGMAMGTNPSLQECAIDAGMMAAASYGSDVVHTMVLDSDPSGMSSAAVTGALYAGAAKLYRNDNNFLPNAALAAANDYATEYFITDKVIAKFEKDYGVDVTWDGEDDVVGNSAASAK